MRNRLIMLQQVLSIAVAWAMLWLLFWMTAMVLIGVIQPKVIDPGEPEGMMTIFGAMGLVSGLLFGVLLLLRKRKSLSLTRVLLYGLLATAFVQAALLGHGDQGLAANIKMALLLTAVGGMVSAVWSALNRRWLHSET